MAIDEDGVIEEKTPRSIFMGTLKLGDASIDCHYLDNGKRVFTQREMVRYFRGPENSHLSRYVERNPLIPRDFLVGQNIIFNVPGNPQPVYGYEATVLIDFCSYYAEALQKGLLKDKWIKLGVLAVATLIACAKTGIIALHDEATGFQRHRDRNALETKFKFFFLDEMSVWVRRFPDETSITKEDMEKLFNRGESKDLAFALAGKVIHEVRDPKIPKGSDFVSINFTGNNG